MTRFENELCFTAFCFESLVILNIIFDPISKILVSINLSIAFLSLSALFGKTFKPEQIITTGFVNALISMIIGLGPNDFSEMIAIDFILVVLCGIICQVLLQNQLRRNLAEQRNLDVYLKAEQRNLEVSFNQLRRDKINFARASSIKLSNVIIGIVVLVVSFNKGRRSFRHPQIELPKEKGTSQSAISVRPRTSFPPFAPEKYPGRFTLPVSPNGAKKRWFTKRIEGK